MKTTKRILVLLAALIMSIGLVACGSSNKNEAGSSEASENKGGNGTARTLDEIKESGVDLSKVNVVVKNESVIITIPEIQIIGNLDWETNSAREYITPDSKLNSNEISPDVKNQTVNRAQKDMREKILNDEKLCAKAEENLKNIIESYVKEMGRLNGVEYKIDWEKQTLVVHSSY